MLTKNSHSLEQSVCVILYTGTKYFNGLLYMSQGSSFSDWLWAGLPGFHSCQEQELFPSPPCPERLWWPATPLSDGAWNFVPRNRVVALWNWPFSCSYCQGLDHVVHVPCLPSWHYTGIISPIVWFFISFILHFICNTPWLQSIVVAALVIATPCVCSYYTY
jgi:hypothetical protein